MKMRKLLSIVDNPQLNRHAITETKDHYGPPEYQRLMELAGITSEVLLEDRIEWMKQNLLPKIEPEAQKIGMEADELFNKIIESDPNPQKKNSQWLINVLLKSHSENILDFLKKAPEILNKFEEYKANKTLEQHQIDINQYKTLDELEQTLNDVDNSKNNDYESQRQQAFAQSIIHEEGEEYILVEPKTRKAAEFFSRSSNWCTAYGCPHGMNPDKTDNAYNMYAETGRLMIAYNTEDPSESYQIHFNEDPQGGGGIEIKNSDDENIEPGDLQDIYDDIPELEEIMSEYEPLYLSFDGEFIDTEDAKNALLLILQKGIINSEGGFYPEKANEGEEDLVQIVYDLLKTNEFPAAEYPIVYPGDMELDDVFRILKAKKNLGSDYGLDDFEDIMVDNANHSNVSNAVEYANRYKNGHWPEYEQSLKKNGSNAAIKYYEKFTNK